MARPPLYTPEVIDGCLLEVAKHGGNIRKAHQTLTKRALELAGEGEDGIPQIPGEQTIRDWIGFRHKDRYQDVLAQHQQALDDQLARGATVHAIAVEEGKDRALRRVLAQIDGANGVEASMILRNLTQSQVASQGMAETITGRERFQERTESLLELARGLEQIGKGAVNITFESAEVREQQQMLEVASADMTEIDEID